jgi:hypothetical protein
MRKTGYRPTLTSEDWTCLQHALDAAEELIFCLSTESRIAGQAMRRVQWPRSLDGKTRPELTLDQSMVDAHKTAIDPIACVVSDAGLLPHASRLSRFEC